VDKVLACSDPHFKWSNPISLNLLYRHAHEKQPDKIVILGDLYDMYSSAKFDKKHFLTPKDEMYQSREEAENFILNLKMACPDAEIYLIKGNHDVRPLKKLLNRAPELEPFIDDKSLWEFDGVSTIHDPREELLIDGNVYIHGHFTRLGAHAEYYQRNVIHGHSHRAGIFTFNSFSGLLFELDCGYLGDPLSQPLSYPRQKYVKWTHACGWIDADGPRIITLEAPKRHVHEDKK